MSFVVAIEGTVTNSTINKIGGGPATVPNWPGNGARFKGAFSYTPSSTPNPNLFPKIFIDFDSFTVTRTSGAGSVSLVNGGAGIVYADSLSTGFTNISLPAGGWELQELTLTFASPQGFGVANPASLAFDLFTVRTISIGGDNGTSASAVAWNILARIDVVIALPD
jgi:hypothetical protein